MSITVQVPVVQVRGRLVDLALEHFRGWLVDLALDVRGRLIDLALMHVIVAGLLSWSVSLTMILGDLGGAALLILRLQNDLDVIVIMFIEARGVMRI